MSEAERITGIHNGYIAKCCKGKCSYAKNFQWSYEKVDKMKAIDKFKALSNRKKDKGKEVYQYTLDGKYVSHYNTIQEAFKITEVSCTGIYKCCQGCQDSAGEYQWFYEYFGETINPIVKEKTNNHKPKEVNVFDKNMNFIQSYSSVQEAIDKLSIIAKSKTSIYECMNNKRKTAHGYIWRYA